MAPSAPSAADDAPEASPFVEHPRDDDDADADADADGNEDDGLATTTATPLRSDRRADRRRRPGGAPAPFLLVLLALSAGAALGLLLPADARHLPDPRWARASNVLGWAAFSVWTLSFWPQILSNRRNRSARGLSPDFVALNVLGFACYASFCALLYWDGAVADEFARRTGGASPVGAAVQLNDVAFALHALAAASITAGQCLRYDRPWRPLSPATRAGLAAAVAVVGAHLLAARAASDAAGVVAGRARRACGSGGGEGGDDPPFAASLLGGGVGGRGDDPPPAPSGGSAPYFSSAPPPPWTLLDVAYTLSAVKMVVTLTKYVPQAAYNFRRRSTVGWSVTNILMDFSGGLCSLAQQLLGAVWWRDLRSVVTANPVRFALSVVSLCFDLLFMLQHYVLFRGARRGRGAAGKRRAGGGDGGEVEQVEDGEEAAEEEERQALWGGGGAGEATAAGLA